MVIRKDAPLVFCCGHADCVKRLEEGVMPGVKVVRVTAAYYPGVWLGEDPDGWNESRSWMKNRALRGD